MERAFYVTGRLFPATLRRKVDVLLAFCGADISAEYWLGRAFIINAVLFAMVACIFFIAVENFVESTLLLAATIGIYQVATYLVLYFKAENRGKAVENVLPSMLYLLTANLHSGMTPFQAFKEASRPELGILKSEMDRAIMLSLSSMQFHEALLLMSSRVKSEMFQDVIELFVEGMRSGGPLATLMSDIALDITEDMDLKKEIITKSKSYIMFIGFIVVVASPLLSAVSVNFIRTITTITNEVRAEMPEIQNVGGITFGELTLSPDFIYKMALTNITITGLIASWLLAIISHGKEKYMIKYALVILPASFIMYYIVDYLIRNFLTV
jgi:hypothetical protein